MKTTPPLDDEPKRICIFAGASSGTNPKYKKSAADLGVVLAKAGYELVYGGGRTGLMGTIADSALAAGGSVIGVIPERLATEELAHTKLTRLEVVSSMHERKHRMAHLSQAFIALPGGIGTFEELFEATTWTQLRIHDKPAGLYNVLGYYDKLLDFLKHATQEHFLKPDYDHWLIADDDPANLVTKLKTWLRPH